MGGFFVIPLWVSFLLSPPFDLPAQPGKNALSPEKRAKFDQLHATSDTHEATPFPILPLWLPG